MAAKLTIATELANTDLANEVAAILKKISEIETVDWKNGQGEKGALSSKAMPHVIIKMYAGRSDEQKRRIAAAVTRALMDEAGASDASISVGIEDVLPADWAETVYGPDIAGKPGTIVKPPGYDPR